jgi:hypothetical protein
MAKPRFKWVLWEQSRREGFPEIDEEVRVCRTLAF